MHSQLSLAKLLCSGVWHWFQCALLPVFHSLVRKKTSPMCQCGLQLCLWTHLHFCVLLLCSFSLRVLWFKAFVATKLFGYNTWAYTPSCHMYTDVPLLAAGSVHLLLKPTGCDSRTWGHELKFPLSLSSLNWKYFLYTVQSEFIGTADEDDWRMKRLRGADEVICVSKVFPCT